MKVAWLLAAFIAIVTYTPQLTCSGAGYVLSWRSQTEIGPIRCEQSDTCLTQKKSLPQSLFLQIKAHYEVP